MARQAPSISHLFFADDSVLFFRSTQTELYKIQDIIASYEAASGQRINLQKSELFASGNVSNEWRENMGTQLGARTVGHYSKYLGLPTLIGRSKSQVFQSIMDRIMSKLKGWKERAPSKDGREVLIKSVIQAIPTYVMSCFVFPKAMCEAIEKAIARFFWGASEEERKIHWASWGKISRSKKHGGIGFREMFFFNIAMVSRQFWRILRNPDSLISRILKARYFPRSGLLEANVGYQPSYLRRSLLKARPLINEGIA